MSLVYINENKNSPCVTKKIIFIIKAGPVIFISSEYNLLRI